MTQRRRLHLIILATALIPLLTGCKETQLLAEPGRADAGTDTDTGGADTGSDSASEGIEDTGTDTDTTPTTGWFEEASGVTAALRAVWGNSGSDVFAVGRDGTIVHFDGQAWSPMVSGVAYHLEDVFGFGAHDVYTVGGNWGDGNDTGVVLHYDGIAWQEVLNVPADESIRAIWGSSPIDIYAMGEDGLRVAYHFDGATWTLLDCDTCPPGGTGIWGSGPDDVFSAGYDGVWHFNGDTWSLWYEGMGMDGIFNDVWGSGPEDVYFAKWYGLLRFNGADWISIPLEEDLYPDRADSVYLSFHSVTGTSASDIYYLGMADLVEDDVEDEQLAIHFDGEHWTRIDIPGDPPLLDIWSVSENEVFAVGGGGAIWHYQGAD